MEPFQDVVTNLGALSYLGIFGGTFVANLFPGVPEEIFLIALGFIIGKGLFSFWICLFIIVAALFITDTILYFVSYRGNKIVYKIGNFLLGGTLEERLPFIQTHITKVIYFARFIFQARFLGPFLAGTVKYPYKKFVVFELLALFTYVPLTFLLGMYFQNRIELIISGVGIVGNIMLFILCLLVAVFIIRLIKKHLLAELDSHAHVQKMKSFFGFKKINN